VRWLLRSPLQRFVSKQLMLVTIKGRVTGRTFTIPVGYIEANDGIYVLVSGPADKLWWRNLDGGAPVELTLRGQVVDAEALVLHLGFERVLERYCKQMPGIAKRLGVPVVGGAVDAAALHDLAQQVVMVRFVLT
jgi:hypothetical protein